MNLSQFETNYLAKESPNYGLLMDLYKTYEFRLFLLHFNLIPNKMEQDRVNCQDLFNWICTDLKDEILDTYYNEKVYNNNKQTKLADVYFVIANNILLHIDFYQSKVSMYHRNTGSAILHNITEKITSSIKEKIKTPFLSLLIETDHGIDLKKVKLMSTPLDISKNYNEDFKQIHNNILEQLSKSNKGLILLHGKDGTGKTSYIRYLISSINKHKIFIPSHLVSQIDSPAFLSLLINNKDSIIVIEDAEKLLENENSKDSSTIINITEGLLSDCLNLQVICTFNTKLEKVNPILLRKKNLIIEYEFNELTPKKATALSKKIGSNIEYITPTLLTDIYNLKNVEAIKN